MQFNITMQLKEIFSYSPASYAYHLQNPPIFSLHPTSHYLAFVTRANEIAFYNRKTARTSILYTSHHGIAHLLFTQKYLIAVEKTTPQVFIFSLKSEKIKKKITGHRSQVLSVAFSPQRAVFCTASHDVCMVWDEATLGCIKVLKCSTSSYYDCHFVSNGHYLFTSFADGNVFGWELDNFELKQSALSIEPHKVTSTCNQFVAVYSPKKISVANFSHKSLIFQSIEGFWQGQIERVEFLESLMLVKTTHGFYLSELVQENKICLQNKKELIDQIHSFQVAKYASEIVIISKDLTKIRLMKIQTNSLHEDVPLTNPLLNRGNHCIGGFSNIEGCILSNPPKISTESFSNQNYKLQQLNDGIYHEKNALSDQKIKNFIRKNYIFPDKYRAVAYKSILQLPISKKDFIEIERKGMHPCTKTLDNKYPLDSLVLSQAMKDVVSLLANYSPVFGESQLVPVLIFPFVCIFGEDRFFCFQVLYRLFNNWLSFLFQNFPLANSELLQNILELFQKEDPAILNHLNSNQISFTKLAWSLLSTLFSTNLSRDGFLAVADTLIANREEPSFLIFMLMAYIQYNRSRIFSLHSDKDLDVFLDQEHTVNISVFIKKAYELKEKLAQQVYFPFRRVNYKEVAYVPFDCYPSHAVKMFEGKRKLQEQQYEKYMNEQRYHDEVAKQMDKMMTKIKRQSDKARIESQAVALQCQSEGKNGIILPPAQTGERRRRLRGLLSKLGELLNSRDRKKQRVKQFMPLLKQIAQSEDELELDEVQSKVMELMTKLEPHQFHVPLNTQPMTFGKQRAGEFASLKAAKRAQVANRLWETDEMGHQLQGNQFEHYFEKAMKM